MISNFTVQKTVVKHTDGSYLILRRSGTDVPKPYEWDLPGGMLDEGETLEDGALREIREEVGLSIDIKTILPRYTHQAITEIKGVTYNYLSIIYVAHTNSKEVSLSYEHDMFEWVSAAEFIERFASQPQYHKAVRYIIDNRLDELA